MAHPKIYIQNLHNSYIYKHKQYKCAQNARHSAMRLVAQPQLIITDLHEILVLHAGSSTILCFFRKRINPYVVRS